MNKWADLIDKLLTKLERLLPMIYTILTLGYKWGSKDAGKIKKKQALTELELERMRNAEKIRERNRGKSDADIVDDAVRQGRDILRKE